MARNNPHDSIQDAVYRAYEAAGGLKATSGILNLAMSTLSSFSEPPGSGKRSGGLGINYAHALSDARPEAAAVFARHFAALAGGVFQLIHTDPKITSLLSHCGIVAKECGEAQAALIRAAESASAKNYETAEKECEEARNAVDEVIAIIRKQRGTA
ncbi:hypothetical protein [Rhodovulum kholense]|uniref:Uncharacterized protein n=1 Tax=Rhodovulum kholense TaxID=453584 RepID=A0A8E3AQL7_9RHOB|nr:hypothetical protein [Rhodovulum kholense]PTW45675.1 hypothetical protein C8N38_11376 [Rhodovulum kholense]